MSTVFETNTFGVMAMTQAVLPQFRARRAGTVVNVTSSATLAPMPLVAAYTASKTAIDGFTASLEHELLPFGVRVKLVVPGYGPDTQFTRNTGPRLEGLIPEAYAPFARRVLAEVGRPAAVTTASDVAEAVATQIAGAGSRCDRQQEQRQKDPPAEALQPGYRRPHPRPQSRRVKRPVKNPQTKLKRTTNSAVKLPRPTPIGPNGVW
jgi:NAD(P)-dependent dehydrogenase (short-subunit alcohol dehydrogenase family)